MPTPTWLDIALAEFSRHVAEISGPENNPRILEYNSATSLKAPNDEIPWCAAFVNWCLKRAGIVGTNSARAKSFLYWGTPVKAPIPGTIMVLNRGRNVDAGHVGFYVGGDIDHVILLGGNQRDCVCEATFPVDLVVAMRWPKQSDRR